MATAVRKPSPSVPPSAPESKPTIWGKILAVFDAIYRFLASLKLAVISLSTLAGALAYATFFESWYGAAAAQEWIYRSPEFAILLAFLGANILCAALIRYPWKKRQTGFVITHAGLLVLLAGSWISVKSADEGQVGMLEGQTMTHLVRRDDAIIRVRKLDPHTGEPDREFPEFELPFQPGHFGWGEGHPRPHGIVASLFSSLTGGAFDDKNPTELLTRPKDPFQLTVKRFIPASIPAVVHEADPDGTPMLEIRPRIKAPGMPRFNDALEGDDRWLTIADSRFGRAARRQMPGLFVFLYSKKLHAADDFLHPPKPSGPDGAVRIRYKDRKGGERSFDWALDGQAGKSITLADSDLHVGFEKVVAIDAAQQGIARAIGSSEIPIAQFRVRQGDGPSADYYAWATLPNAPNLIPSKDGGPSPHRAPLVEISYYLPPEVGGDANGLRGMVEVLGTPDGSLYCRVFGRSEKIGEPKLAQPIKKGEEITAFGGSGMAPMTMKFSVEDFLVAGRERDICVPIELAKGKKDENIQACLVEMNVDGKKGSFWIRRSATLDPLWKRVEVGGESYELAYDSDRRNLNFQLKLVDFDRLFDPGTQQPSRFQSQVLLTDEGEGIKNKPILIAMNAPLTHRGYTFYQSSYQPEFDPRTNQPTGEFLSILQVGTDSGRWIKYLGCALVVLGAFVQFYMRAGVFTDGGKREREWAETRARKLAGQPAQNPETIVTDVNEADETL
jgi:hypothetical protein